MKVLIGVDDSAHAEKTIEFARRFPWAADTTIVVCSVAPLSPVGNMYPESFGMAALDTGAGIEQLTKLHLDLAAQASQKLKEAGLRAEGRVLRGDPRELLIEEARKERADLMVVGTHGRTGFDKLLMGSVASHVVTHAPCNVLVVRR